MKRTPRFEQFSDNPPSVSKFNSGDRVVLNADYTKLGGEGYELTHPVKGDHGSVIEKVQGWSAPYYRVRFDRFPQHVFVYHADELITVK